MCIIVGSGSWIGPRTHPDSRWSSARYFTTVVQRCLPPRLLPAPPPTATARLREQRTWQHGNRRGAVCGRKRPSEFARNVTIGEGALVQRRAASNGRLGSGGKHLQRGLVHRLAQLAVEIGAQKEELPRTSTRRALNGGDPCRHLLGATRAPWRAYWRAATTRPT